jgi:hypothetical protein
MKKTTGLSTFVLLLLSLSTYGQRYVDYYIQQDDSTEVKSLEISDTVNTMLDLSPVEHAHQSTVATANDSIAQLNSFINSLEDSLQSIEVLREMDLKREALLDTLATFNLPSELSDMIDSLRALPSSVEELGSKLDLQKYQSADTLVTRYIDKAKNLISDQQQKIGEKTSSLLPEEFYSKLESMKGKGELDANALSKVKELTSKYELDYKKYLSMNKLQETLNMDMEFLNDLESYQSQLGDYTGKMDEYLGDLNSYLGKSDVQGLTNTDVKSLDQYTGDLGLDGINELEGLDTDEVEKLISDYGSLDADQLDQRIDQMAGNYGEINELNGQLSAFEGMQSEQLGELEQLNSYAGMKFDEKMALKKGQVLANEQLLENAEIVQTAMKEVDALKKKYAIVTNSNFKEEDVEKPVKHVQLQKRFFYGGDFQLLPGEPFGIDFSGLAGYKISNRASLGLAGSVRYEFEESENYMPDFDKEPVYGGRTFLQYTVIKAFFVQGEVEAANVYNESQRKIWEINYLAGIGRSMSIKDKLKLNVTFLYHINNKGSYAHDRPFVIRVGFTSM